MFVRIIVRVLRVWPFPKILIKPVLFMHSLSYKLAAGMGMELEGGWHPKHRITRYKEWFVDNVNNNDVVLDIGCNTGLMPFIFGETVKYVYGIEINSKLLKEAERSRKRDNIEYISGDATNYDYSQCRPISCITMSNVLEHIESRVKFLKALTENVVWRDQENKKILIRVPMIDRDWIVIYKKEMGVEHRLDPTHFTEYTFIEFGEELSRAEIDVVSYEIRYGEIYAVCRAR